MTNLSLLVCGYPCCVPFIAGREYTEIHAEVTTERFKLPFDIGSVMLMGNKEPIIFPPFQLEAANQRLSRGDQTITLRPKAFAVLLYLLQRPDQLVTKGELLGACWRLKPQ